VCRENQKNLCRIGEPARQDEPHGLSPRQRWTSKPAGAKVKKARRMSGFPAKVEWDCYRPPMAMPRQTDLLTARSRVSIVICRAPDRRRRRSRHQRRCMSSS
jgi:hypothetical protein